MNLTTILQVVGGFGGLSGFASLAVTIYSAMARAAR